MTRNTHLRTVWLAAFFMTVINLCNSSCSNDELSKQLQQNIDQASGGTEEGSEAEFDVSIGEYNGETADDANNDIVGTDEDFYWEVNAFTSTVNITYNETTATVVSNDENILYDVQGAHVTIDMQTNSAKNVEISISGKSDDGSLKIYGEKKFKLTFNGVELTSSSGPAINSQCKKRIFVHLAEGTTNRLTDAATYTDDSYYLSGSTADEEDRKGCFFSEGNLVFSGTGVLIVQGNQKHGIATDGYFYMRPGVTIAVTGAAKNAIHVKGDSDDGIGIYMGGGLIYANVSSMAGKCLKTDLDAVIAGGKLILNTSGDSEYDEDEGDTSSASCIKTDGDVNITGGTLTLKSTGSGGKGINADGNLYISGGVINAVTSGGKYIYTQNLTSSPKGIKADGDITIDGGQINISVTGASDSSEGLESKGTLTVNDGEIYVYAYDDAINASTAVNINGGKIYAYSVNNDGIDSNGSLTVTGGLVIASGCASPEEGFDCDNSNNFKISGGTLIGTGGNATSPSSASTQHTVIYNGITASKGSLLYITNSEGSTILAYELPRSINNGLTLFFSSPDLTSGTYTAYTSGSISNYADYWNGWYSGGTCSEGNTLGTFTSTSIVTTVGNSNMGGGNNPGGTSGPGGFHGR